MTDQELRNLAATVEDLKKAVSKNSPELRAMLRPRGWMPLTLIAGIGVGLFCLPAQVLVVAYGSFGAIPAAFRTALWCVLVLVLVLSGVWKMVLLTRKIADEKIENAFLAVLRSFFAGQSFHIGVPFTLSILVLSAFAVWSGHPWYVVPAVAIPTCFWANFVATLAGSPAFKAAGWWSLVTGLASLFFIEKAPFIWLFVILGGLMLVFAGALLVTERRERAEGR
jgi:hypothetical protein